MSARVNRRLPSPTDDGGLLLDLLDRNVAAIPSSPAITDAGRTVTWSEYGEMATSVALALDELGVGRGDTVGLHQSNRLEHLVGDLAALKLGAVPISVYSTLSAEQLEFVANDSSMRVLIAEPAYLSSWESVRSRLPGLTHIVLLDSGDTEREPDPGILSWTALVERGRELAADGAAAILSEARAQIGPGQTATVVYTSGTTGNPKGVLLTHQGIRFTTGAVSLLFEREIATSKAADASLSGRDDPTVSGSSLLSYLPFAHAAERFSTHYLSLEWGSHVHMVRELDQLRSELPEARPALFLAVPRVWEKFASAMNSKLAEAGGPRARLAAKALMVATDVGRHRSAGTTPPRTTRITHSLFEHLVYARLRETMGLDRCAMALSGAAPIDADLLATFSGIGIPIIEGYGMTETSGMVSITSISQPRAGTVGRPFSPKVEIRISGDDEILVRGPNVTPGYLGRPEATAEAIDADGWLHTGDLGRLDSSGVLSIIGRKKELIINAAGKNISPNGVETVIKGASPLIAQVVAIGDRRPYLVALIVLDPDALAEWARTSGTDPSDLSALTRHPEVRREVEAAVATGNARLARVEQIKDFAIVDDFWTPESAELTPTMKLRRDVIGARHEQSIEALYRRPD